MSENSYEMIDNLDLNEEIRSPEPVENVIKVEEDIQPTDIKIKKLADIWNEINKSLCIVASIKKMVSKCEEFPEKEKVILHIVDNFKHFTPSHVTTLFNNALYNSERKVDQDPSMYITSGKYDLDVDLFIKVMSRIMKLSNVNTTLYLNDIRKINMLSDIECGQNYFRIIDFIFKNVDQDINDFNAIKIKNYIESQMKYIILEYCKYPTINIEFYIDQLELLASPDTLISIYNSLSTWLFPKSINYSLASIPYNIQTKETKCFYLIAKHKLKLQGINTPVYHEYFKIWYNFEKNTKTFECKFKLDHVLAALEEFAKYEKIIENDEVDVVLDVALLSSSEEVPKHLKYFNYLKYLMKQRIAKHGNGPPFMVPNGAISLLCNLSVQKAMDGKLFAMQMVAGGPSDRTYRTPEERGNYPDVHYQQKAEEKVKRTQTDDDFLSPGFKLFLSGTIGFIMGIKLMESLFNS
jgi:hypothetical protein